ncbi:hypothetical protein SynA1528_02372 [Synechococcus sp. A15-28]|nr:hypothetical protein SynA1528_02372 [Synechococcus sp. A15-28]
MLLTAARFCFLLITTPLETPVPDWLGAGLNLCNSTPV